MSFDPMTQSDVRLADAEPGDVLIDTDCDEWVRTETGAVCMAVGGPVTWRAADFDEAEENFGPFAPLRRGGKREAV